MFKLKLNNGKLVDATNKSIFIDKKAVRDGELEYSGDIVNSSTQLTRIIIKDIKSIVTDDKEINIDTSKPTAEIIKDIKSAFNEYNIVQTDSESPDEEDEQPVTVIYLVDGEEYFTATGLPGESYKMTQPTKDGHNFIGWDTDDNNQTFPTEDTTYNAVFEPIDTPTENEPVPEIIRDTFTLSDLGSITTVEGSIDDLFDANSSGTFNGAVLTPIEPSTALSNALYIKDYNNISISASADGGEVLTDQSVFDPNNFKIVVTEGTTRIYIVVTTTFVA